MELLYALQRLDVRLFSSVFRQGRRRLVRPLARAVSRSADGYLYISIPSLLWLAGSPGTLTLTALLLLSLSLERPLYWLLKNGLKRPRPADALPNFRSLVVAADKFSFPSGHTSAAFMLVTCLTVVFQDAAFFLFAWAASVALSRVVLGVHYPGDTLAGALMGTSAALFTASLLGV